MPAVPADLSIKARWIVPMTRRDEILEHHTLVMRDGRIIDLLPSAAARNATLPEYCWTALAPIDAGARQRADPDGIARSCMPSPPQFKPEGALLCIANMLEAGITCFCDVGYFPRQAAETAAAQGMRALIGLPVAEHRSPWAQSAAEYSDRALGLRDDYKGHPYISTGFAPLRVRALSDATLRSHRYAGGRTRRGHRSLSACVAERASTNRCRPMGCGRSSG